MHLCGAQDIVSTDSPPPVDRESVLLNGPGARDRQVGDGYDKLAKAYAAALADELDAKPFDRWLLDRLAETAAGGQGLDVGCGPGQVAGYLAARDVAMTGLDLSSAMLEELSLRHPAVQVIRGSFAVPPMPRGTDARDPGWAVITSWYGFVHLASSEIAPNMAALTGALRRGGTLAVAVHLGNEVQHPEQIVGVDTELDFVLHDQDVLVAAAESAGLTDLEWYVRGPLESEAQTPRLYLLGRRPERIT